MRSCLLAGSILRKISEERAEDDINIRAEIRSAKFKATLPGLKSKQIEAHRIQGLSMGPHEVSHARYLSTSGASQILCLLASKYFLLEADVSVTVAENFFAHEYQPVINHQYRSIMLSSVPNNDDLTSRLARSTSNSLDRSLPPTSGPPIQPSRP